MSGIGVYPRVGGGNAAVVRRMRDISGLSPRGRGKLPERYHACRCRGSIPAWAGETWTTPCASRSARVYPRVGGGNKSWCPSRPPKTGLSPRGRGKRQRGIHPRGRDGSIPAWAGETAAGCGCIAPWRVYPRVGGGNDVRIGDTAITEGLSPRGRGKHLFELGSPESARSIPAWAGETSASSGPSGSSGVYPRVGGGNQYVGKGSGADKGLSPRGRGKRGSAPAPPA